MLAKTGPVPAPPNWYGYVRKKWAEYYVVHPLFYAYALIWHVYFELWNYSTTVQSTDHGPSRVHTCIMYLC